MFCPVSSAFYVPLCMQRASIKKIKVDSTKYVNIETGETLGSEYGDIAHISAINAGHRTLRSNRFCIVDMHALGRVKRITTDADFGRVTKLLEYIQGDYNALHGENGRPINKKQLMELVGLSRNPFSQFLDRMMKIGVIYIMSGYKRKKAVHKIIINPTLARTRNNISKECLSFFEDLSSN